MFDLICTNPFGDYVRGQRITDQDLIATLMPDREHHFVRVPTLPPPPTDEVPPPPPPAESEE